MSIIRPRDKYPPNDKPRHVTTELKNYSAEWEAKAKAANKKIIEKWGKKK